MFTKMAQMLKHWLESYYLLHLTSQFISCFKQSCHKFILKTEKMFWWIKQICKRKFTRSCARRLDWGLLIKRLWEVLGKSSYEIITLNVKNKYLQWECGMLQKARTVHQATPETNGQKQKNYILRSLCFIYKGKEQLLTHFHSMIYI